MKNKLFICSFFLFILIFPAQVLGNSNESSPSITQNKDGWVLVNQNWYYSNDGAYVTGWLRNHNKWYFLDSNGVMKTGWIYDKNQWYFLDKNGAMLTGWVKDQNSWYFLDKNGAMKTGWIKSANNWYYLKGNGAMQTGWLKLDQKWYYLQPSGKMATGWYQVQSEWYYSLGSGALATNTTIDGYYVNNYGVWVQPYYVNGVLLVNKTHSLPSTYSPGENSTARAAFETMKRAAAKDGIVLEAFSTYRSYSYQGSLYNRYVARNGQAEADTFSARPGNSEHQTGLAFDIGGKNKGLWAEDEFANTAEAKWLANNAHHYGFILRYLKGKEHITGYIFEPWHYRYVGTELAPKIHQSGLTLEEYLGVN
ncbi:hypothetical protein E1I69_22790 [Bacillus timonensis]|uniref:D-alanyl-D-alanine carboxypeptidase-like core domain-containing protein n=1 Tax=Bacillus timonensis TaxID=1033734 RepID=A0A4V3V700_9BACI|nr:M15 family metallopeptidase [Bacillus timonensis]THE09323.1 hypothetical protein E1I69_22790 [Bacillus timonensis]